MPGMWWQPQAVGEDVSEQLEIIDEAFKVIRHVRRKKACACCDCIVQAPAPGRTIERSIAGPGLLAHIAVAKFADRLQSRSCPPDGR